MDRSGQHDGTRAQRQRGGETERKAGEASEEAVSSAAREGDKVSKARQIPSAAGLTSIRYDTSDEMDGPSRPPPTDDRRDGSQQVSRIN